MRGGSTGLDFTRKDFSCFPFLFGSGVSPDSAKASLTFLHLGILFDFLKILQNSGEKVENSQIFFSAHKAVGAKRFPWIVRSTGSCLFNLQLFSLKYALDIDRSKDRDEKSASRGIWKMQYNAIQHR